jgi:hypothetical protein
MKNILLILLTLLSLNLNAQSFSDYKDYKLNNDYFKVKSKNTNTVFMKNGVLYCKIIRENKLESGYLFIITDGDSLNVKMNETDFFSNFKSCETMMDTELKYYCDNKRHLICVPYSIENLHKMGSNLLIDKCWYHIGKFPHYDIPKKRIEEIKSKCTVVSTKTILKLIKSNQ